MHVPVPTACALDGCVQMFPCRDVHDMSSPWSPPHVQPTPCPPCLRVLWREWRLRPACSRQLQSRSEKRRQWRRWRAAAVQRQQQTRSKRQQRAASSSRQLWRGCDLATCIVFSSFIAIDSRMPAHQRCLV